VERKILIEVGPDIHRAGLVEVAHKEQVASVGNYECHQVDQLVERAMILGADAGDDSASVAELQGLARDDELDLERAIRACLALPVSLAARHRAIELLARARYEDPSPPPRPSGLSLPL
jgi:hypothetical protein